MTTTTAGNVTIVNTIDYETSKMELVAKLFREHKITIEEMVLLLKTEYTSTISPVETNFVPIQKWKNKLWMQENASVNSTGQITI